MNIFYNIFIYPIQFFIEIIFYILKVHTESSNTVSIILLSIFVNIISLPLYNIAEKWQKRERDIQNKMKPMIDNIKSVYKGDQRFLLIRACYRINGYKTIYAFRGTLGLLIQIPFFIAAYNFISNIPGLELEKFWFINDLSKPDALLKLGNYSINILPFIMTLFSLLSGLVYAKKLTLKEQIPLYAISLIFLFVLYNSPSALLIYWTVNCIFSFVKNIILETKNGILVKYIGKGFRILYYAYFVCFIFITFLFLFRSNIIELAKKYDFLNNFVLYVKSYYDMLVIWIILTLCMAVYFYIKKSQNVIITKNKFLLFIFSIISLSILAGLFIPSALIGSSGQEFDLPFLLIGSNFSKFIGFFIVYPIGIYFLFSDKIKNLLIYLYSFISFYSIINTFLMVGNYGNINTDFKFELEYLLVASSLQTIISVIISLLLILIIYFILKKRKEIFLININLLFIIVLVILSVSNLFIINREQEILKNINASSGTKVYNNKVFNISTTGTNVFIMIFDRGAPQYYSVAFDRFPELEEQMDGFLWYTNNVSFYDYTVSSIQSLYGGYEYTPYELTTNNYVLVEKHNEALLMLPQLFYNNGYTSVMFEPIYANFSQVTDLSLFAKHTNINAYKADFSLVQDYIDTLIDKENMNRETKITINNSEEEIMSTKMSKNFRFSIFRMLPIYSRNSFYKKNWLLFDSSQYTKSFNTSIKEYSFLTSLSNLTTINSNGNYFNFFYNAATHEPYNINSDFEPHFDNMEIPKEDLEFFGTEFNARSYYVNVASIKQVIKFCDFLKSINAYDNTKIIIVSDHSYFYTPSLMIDLGMEQYNGYWALLLMKDFNSRGKLKRSGEFMTTAETAYLASRHLTNRVNPYTGKIITNDYKNHGAFLVDNVSWRLEDKQMRSFNFDSYYIVKDNIFEKTNWQKFNYEK